MNDGDLRSEDQRLTAIVKEIDATIAKLRAETAALGGSRVLADWIKASRRLQLDLTESNDEIWNRYNEMLRDGE